MSWTYTSCAPCCINMGCGFPRVPPTELTATASITGSCPQAAATPLAVTVVMVPPTCEELCTGNPCACFFSWVVADADRASCQPYIDHISLECKDADTLALAEGCDHVRYQNRIWYGEVGVTNTDVVLPAHNCVGPAGDPPPAYHCVQDCGTCLWSAVLGAGDDVCCDTCPPCTACASHQAARCAANIICCGSTGCEKCPPCGPDPPCSGSCAQCTHCWQVTPGSSHSETCGGCTMSFTNRTYHFWGYACPPNVIKGCNPTSCPPDPDHYGNFYLLFDCGAGDFLSFSCPVTGMMITLRRRLPPNKPLLAELVRRMSQTEVDELLHKLRE